MLPENFENIKPADLMRLVDEKVSENRLLEYKQELPIRRKEGDAKEFLADVSAFANAAGGGIIYGFTEEVDATGKKTGRPGKAVGVQITEESVDEIVRRLHQLSHSGLDPAIPGLRIREIVADGKSFIVLRIPRSWVAPHMVSLDATSRFFVRIDNAKIMMDREQIRQAFLFSETTRKHIDRFRDERLGRILSGDIGVPLQNSWQRILHLVPTGAFNGSISLDFSVVDFFAGNSPKFAGALSRRFNVDGILCATDVTGESPSRRFIQVFRTGIIEFITTGDIDLPGVRGDVPGIGTENRSFTEIANCLEFYRSQSVPMPIIAMLSFLNMRGRRLRMQDDALSRSEYSFDRSTIVLPGLVLDSYDIEIKTALMALVDAFWQSGGHRRSPSYDRLT